VNILPPNRIGLLLQINGRLGLRIVAANIAHICIKKSSNVRANKTPRSRHAGNGLSNAQQNVHEKSFWMLGALSLPQKGNF
jgi:hypothetical protein